MIMVAGKTNGRTSVRPFGDINTLNPGSHALLFLLRAFVFLCHGATP
jgi:hypothetical protein